MRILSLLILSIGLLSFKQQPESPHGQSFKISCKTCHSTKGWQLDKDVYSFDHNTTSLPLVGQHKAVACRQCHPTLKFAEAKTNCNECHTDIHQATVGLDCSRCHTPSSWLVSNITEIHQRSRFPLVGSHRTTDCSQCHKSENLARYDVPGVNCVDCHRQNYLATTSPNHIQSGISEDCILCHKINAIQWAGAGFDHSAFPLLLGHSNLKCIDCHTTGIYTSISSDCYSCHEQNYTATINPNHIAAGITTACVNCHSTTPGWKPASFSHTVFPLTLGHAAPTCTDCHKGNYSTTPTDCYQCHQSVYNATTDPNHVTSGIPTTCETCHTTKPGWKPAITDHSTFPLTLGHSVPTCNDCHKGNYTTTPVDCYFCHQQNYAATTTPNHILSGIPTTCTICHTVAPGWKPATFNHTIFPLTLGHSTPTCNDCHKGNYTSTSPDCFSCHQSNYTATTNPNHIAAGIAATCATCHTTNPGWTPASFNHTFFPLTLGHSTPACNDCHKGNYTTLSPDCYTCHQTNYTATTNPNHIASGIPVTCAVCHTTNPGWTPASINHTIFPLTLGHATPTCNDCHKGNYATLSPDCYTCHQANYTATTNPNHITAGIPTTCAICHTTNPGWIPATVNHTAFPLTLGHSTPSCNDCHKGNYTTTSTDCYSCHQANYTATTNPNHIAAGIPSTCATCHTTNPGWTPATYSHTTFPLTLGHSAPTCYDCHKGNYTTTSSDCYTCHQANYTATTNPNHITSGIPTTCATCHTTNPGWTPATFSHTTFPLTLGHSVPTCNDCHKGNYTTTSKDCYACHQANYTATTNPNHITAGIPTTCATCHTTNPGWTPATFSHTTFPLTLGHSVPTCNDCHKGNYTTTSKDCYVCHQANYTATTNPNHIAAGIPTTCATCHTTNPGWTPATFSHTTFPLTLGHSVPTCNDCHKGNYTTTSKDCYTCHQANYTSTTNPNHIAAGIPTTCATCHTTNPGWTPATFTHTTFQLTLGHATPTCNDCHKGNYTTTSTACYSCHAADYDNTTNPNHKTLAFSTTCNSCHTTTPGWKPATFTQHDALFPIYSGRHLGQWNACTDCHTNTANYSSFSCIICHEHNSKASVDSHHDGVSGYTYTGTSCYTCHPTGRAG